MKKYKEWLTNEIEVMESETSENYPHEQMVEREVVLNLINQPDEPEALSQEWVDENSMNLPMNSPMTRWVPVSKLQNLLVPKQETAVIPKYVAEWIEANREVYGNELLSIGYDFYNNAIHPEVDNWIIKNEQKFVRAWLDGYTVEEEPLYTARLKVITGEYLASYLRTQSSSAEDRLKSLDVGNKYIHEDYRHLSEFTEHELKVLDVWDSDQWVVEEVEESEGGAQKRWISAKKRRIKMITKSDKYADYIKDHPSYPTVEQTFYKFPNGYGASVIYCAFTYGLELAVLKWDKDGGDWEIDYTTPITDDVVGHIEDLDLILGDIYDLPEEKEPSSKVMRSKIMQRLGFILTNWRG